MNNRGWVLGCVVLFACGGSGSSGTSGGAQPNEAGTSEAGADALGASDAADAGTGDASSRADWGYDIGRISSTL